MKMDVEVKKEFEKIGKYFKAIDRCFQSVEKRFEAIDQRFEVIDQRFEVIDQRFEAIDQRFEAIEKRFEAIEKRFECLVTRLEFEYAIDSLCEQIVTRKDIDALVTTMDSMALEFHTMYRSNTISQSQFVDTQDKVRNHEKRISILERKTA